MPYEIRQVGNKWRLYNLHKKKYAKKSFNSKQAAINSAKVYMKYRYEHPYVQGNYVLDRK